MNPETRARLNEIAAEHDATLDQLRGPNKFRVLVDGRAACYRYLTEERGWAHVQVAKLFNRDRTAVTLSLDKNHTRPVRLQKMKERKARIKAVGLMPLGARRVG